MPSEAFAHVWLPGATKPVVCGRITAVGAELRFLYGQSYLARADAVALDPRELPLRRGVQRPPHGDLHGALRDASPDAWGRRVLLARSAGRTLTELDFLLGAGLDRIGALAVSRDPDLEGAEVSAGRTELVDLAEAARRVEAREPLPPHLDAALLHGTSVGGARPKALLDDRGRKCIAKLSSSTDRFPVVRCERAAMVLADRCGLAVARTELAACAGRDVLVVERFDRVETGAGWSRRLVLSALTALALHETEARLASYLDLAGFFRRFGADPAGDCEELFRRMVFNILIGNTDDHARNHALFWDGVAYRLTPAYDLVPVLRAGRTASQAMVVGRDGRHSTLRNALSEAGQFGLAPTRAAALIDDLLAAVETGWPEVADAAGLTTAERAALERETVLGPGCLE